jgi:mevalonate kinase
MENRNYPFQIFSSAPAKIILTGEHAVCYGSGAITCAIDLKTSVKMEILNLEEKETSFMKFFNLKKNHNYVEDNFDLNIDTEFLIYEIFYKLIPIFSEITDNIHLKEIKYREIDKIFEVIEKKLSEEKLKEIMSKYLF